MCNDQIAATRAVREKYGKDNVKVIAFIFDKTFNDDKDREKNRGLIKTIVEDRKPAIEGQSVPEMDFDAYIVWSYATYVKHLNPLRFKKEPLLTAIVDQEGNFIFRQTDRNVSKEVMVEQVGKLLKPAGGAEPPKEAPKSDDTPREEPPKAEPPQAAPPKEEPAQPAEMTQEEAGELFRESMLKHEEKKFDESIAGFKRIYEKFSKEEVGSTAAYNIACGYALSGKKDLACEWLEKAMDAGFEKFDHIKQDTDLDSIRDEPKYKALMGREPL